MSFLRHLDGEEFGGSSGKRRAVREEEFVLEGGVPER